MGVKYPVPKHFRILPGSTFLYSFQYIKDGIPVDLTNYTATWTIAYDQDGVPTETVYDTSATPGESGVFFGGNTQDPTNGFIALLITADDTAVIPWRYATYRLALTLDTTFVLLSGGLGLLLSDSER